MDLIIETDLGHDPDDLFAICYLIAAGVKVRALLIQPGDPDQIAMARLICQIADISIPIGAAKPNRTKLSSGGVHHQLLKHYHLSLEAKADGLGSEIAATVHAQFPDAEAFVIGPVTSLGTYLKQSAKPLRRATMQGGFLPYDLHQYQVKRLPEFDGKKWQPTFNLNGDRPNGINFLSAPIAHRQMVGKNVCHTILFQSDRLSQLDRQPVVKNTGAYELFTQAAKMYFADHDVKKFHDPTAACLHLHPEIATWIRGSTVKMESGWGTILNPDGDYICAAVDEELLWNYLLNMC